MSDLNRQSGKLQVDWGAQRKKAATSAFTGLQLFSRSIHRVLNTISVSTSRSEDRSILYCSNAHYDDAEAQTLRVQITVSAGEPKQLIGPLPAWSMPTIDVSAEADPRAAAEAWMRADLARPIEPTRAPLFGYALFKAAADQFFWYARYHHIVMDGFGMWLMARRLAEVYTQLSSGQGAQDGAFWLPRRSAGRRCRLSGVRAIRVRSAVLVAIWPIGPSRSASAVIPWRNPTAASCATRSISNGRLFVSSAPSRTAWGPAPRS